MLVDEIIPAIEQRDTRIAVTASLLMCVGVIIVAYVNLRFEWDMLRSALKDSPSLANRATADIKRAYEHAIVVAELHGEAGWPKRCPWKSFQAFRAAVGARNAQYLALERAGDAGFGGLRRAPWEQTS